MILIMLTTFECHGINVIVYFMNENVVLFKVTQGH